MRAELLALLLLGVLLGPIPLFLWGARRERKAEILSLFSDKTIGLYFELFHPAREIGAEQRRSEFESSYDQRYGFRRYLFPILALALVAWVATRWGSQSVVAWIDQAEAPLPALAVGALAGAYVWVLADLLDRWRHRDLSPVDLWWGALRFVLAVPLGYALAPLASETFQVGIGFLMGAFPTRTLFTFSRRIARHQLALEVEGGSEESEIQKLQGVDRRVAERFADEGITTLSQLAYSDPVELTMRCSSYPFSFITDLASQSLARIYLGDAMKDLGPYALRGAHEIGTLIDDLDSDDAKASGAAHKAIDAVAAKLEIPPLVLTRTLREIAEDPYTEFIRDVWG
jgi:hypothetical protein